MSRNPTIHLLALLLALMGTAPASAQQPQKPNVVFILADNVGYGDLGSYGGGECAEHRPLVSTSWPARDCVSRSSWSSRPARRRERR